MKPVLYISEKIVRDYRSNLFHLFSMEIRQSIEIANSFKNLSSKRLPIFTNCTNFIEKKISDAKIVRYGMILDAEELNNTEYNLSIILQAEFVIILGNLIESQSEKLNKLKNVKIYNALVRKMEKKHLISEYFTDYDSLGYAYSMVQTGEICIDSLSVIKTYNDISRIWQKQFEFYGIKLDFYVPNEFEYKTILEENSSYIGKNSRILRDLNIYQSNSNDSELTPTELVNMIDNYTEINLPNDKNRRPIINIVCFNPTYLFKDLVNRFVDVGCIHSDLPIPDADSYIWMRPQEIWHIDFLIANKKNPEIGMAYQKAFNGLNLSYGEFNEIKKRSVAIHHGTCFEPLYQFNYENLASSLKKVHTVVGVCEFEECYGPSLAYATSSNFVFVPIGYDKNLFNGNLVKEATRKPKTPLKIGFVGRAYGTNDKKQLASSRMAEPKGYRKGGDILFNIALRLKNLGVDFELQILGQNWEELVEQLDEYQINNHYFARDKDLTYKDYPNVYKEFDLLLITARCEGGPVSAIEALSLGVDVVSTDVGVVKFLAKNLRTGCQIFEYDKKWHIADIEQAVEHILHVYNKTRTFQDRMEIRKSVEMYDTDYWIKSIMACAEKIIE